MHNSFDELTSEQNQTKGKVMNNKFDELTKSIVQSVTHGAARRKFGLGAGLALILALPVFISPGNTPDPSPTGITLTGNSDWSIVPAALTPQFVFNGTDGELYIRHLPLIGRITLAGRAASIEGKISADFNGDVDGTFSGPVWAPVTITAIVNGTSTVIFEGNALGSTVGLVSAGTMKLSGRGPYEGASLEIEFTENGPGNTDTYTLKATLIQGSGN